VRVKYKKTAIRWRMAVSGWLLAHVSAQVCVQAAVNQNDPNLLWEVGIGRRERANAVSWNILGGILPSTWNMSIPNIT